MGIESFPKVGFSTLMPCPVFDGLPNSTID